MGRAEPGSDQFGAARSELKTIIDRLSPDQRTDAATALMGRYAADNVNSAAIALFGPDAFPREQVRRIVFNSRRNYSQRVLIRTYYGLCRCRGRDGQVSDSACGDLLRILCDRLESLAGAKVGYGEQRMLVHLTSSMLHRYAGRPGGQARSDRLASAIRRYAEQAGVADSFAAAAKGWLRLIDSPVHDLSSPSNAIAAIGHWDELARLEASASLSRTAGKDEEVAERLWRLLEDPRDEVRAAAAISLGACNRVGSARLIERMIKVLLSDRGVVVQSAAGAAVAGRADEAGSAIRPLIDAFTPAPGKRLPKPKRSASIMSTLAPLAGQATGDQKAAMLELALRKLNVSPSGALRLLKGLGPSALPALPQIRRYRAQASRFHRQYIDRHVIPAIKFGAAP